MATKSKPTLDKKDIFWQVLNAAIALDIKRGSRKWSMTELSHDSKISRTLIYYYFGKSKENILLEAVHLFGQEFSGSTPERMDAWKQGQIAETLYATQTIFKHSPLARVFYTLNRDEKTVIGETIRDYEKKLRKKIALFFPSLNKHELEGVYAMIQGIALTPGLSLEDVQGAISVLRMGLIQRPSK